MTTATATKKTVKVSAKKSTAKSTFEAIGENAKQSELDNTSKVETLKAVASKKVNVVPEKRDIPATTPDHLSPKSHTVVINCVWKDMQKLAKEWDIKAGGRGVTSDVLHTWLCDFQKLGREGFAAKHPEAVKKAETTKGSKSPKNSASPVIENHVAFKGLTFRESQALVKSKGWKVEGVRATSWASLNTIATAHAK